MEEKSGLIPSIRPSINHEERAKEWRTKTPRVYIYSSNINGGSTLTALGGYHNINFHNKR